MNRGISRCHPALCSSTCVLDYNAGPAPARTTPPLAGRFGSGAARWWRFIGSCAQAGTQWTGTQLSLSDKPGQGWMAYRPGTMCNSNARVAWIRLQHSRSKDKGILILQGGCVMAWCQTGRWQWGRSKVVSWRDCQLCDHQCLPVSKMLKSNQWWWWNSGGWLAYHAKCGGQAD
jgi:hypothetical protein